MKDNNKNQEEFSKTNINWYPGHMAKTKRQIIEDMKLIDVVIELLDSRIPISSQNPNIAEITKNKKKIIVLNKCDLSDEKQNKLWVEYFKSKNIPAVLVDSNSGKGIDNFIKEVEKIMQVDLEQHAQKGRTGRKIRAMILGIPNVGKSSLINKILGEKRNIVSDIAGTTRDAIDSPFENEHGKYVLIDTAGIRKKSKVNESIEKYSVMRSLLAVERADVCLMMIDANDGVTEQDAKIAGEAHEAGKGVIIVVNKWDEYEKTTGTLEKYKKEVYNKLSYLSYAFSAL